MLEHLKQLEQLDPDKLYEQGYYNKPIIITFDNYSTEIQFGCMELKYLIHLIKLGGTNMITTNLKIKVDNRIENKTKAIVEFENCSNPELADDFIQITYDKTLSEAQVYNDIKSKIDTINACYQLNRTITVAQIQLRSVCYLDTHKQIQARKRIETLLDLIDTEINNLAENFEIEGLPMPELNIRETKTEEIK